MARLRLAQFSLAQCGMVLAQFSLQSIWLFLAEFCMWLGVVQFWLSLVWFGLLEPVQWGWVHEFELSHHFMVFGVSPSQVVMADSSAWTNQRSRPKGCGSIVEFSSPRSQSCKSTAES